MTNLTNAKTVAVTEVYCNADNFKIIGVDMGLPYLLNIHVDVGGVDGELAPFSSETNIGEIKSIAVCSSQSATGNIEVWAENAHTKELSNDERVVALVAKALAIIKEEAYKPLAEQKLRNLEFSV